ncbi:MAG TPA: NBR1-Ig-like domain-containing protein [Anaerolineales bacterium]|nr:NBR1-Ig-like domain-containing protein [Anaerolineales bacterium]
MKQPTRRILFTALTVVFLLAACAPAQPQTPNPDDVAHQVATSVALTVAAQDLDTAEAQPVVTDTAVPTATLVAVDTPTPIQPTATPLVLASPTTVPGSGGGGGGTTTNTQYACGVIHQRPFDFTVFKPGDKFDIKWTIVNTGTRTMRDGLDLKFNSGTKLNSGATVELPELEPDEQFALEFDAVAPAKEGTYVMTYIVEGGLCYPYVAIKVER